MPTKQFYYKGLWITVTTLNGRHQVNILSARPSSPQSFLLGSILSSQENPHNTEIYFAELSTKKLVDLHLYQRALEIAMDLWGSFDLIVGTNHLPKGALLQPTIAA